MSAPPDAQGRTVHPLPPLAAHRQRLIEAELRGAGAVSTSELAARWGLSPSSITRDLSRLAAEGRCRRVRGGALAPASRWQPAGTERQVS